jgi:LmbE family N-acetylglucosaminyl deacetylase
VAGLIWPGAAPAQLEPTHLDRGAVGLGLALRRLGTTARVLYVTAHPDDEHNGVLVRLARGRGLRTALFTLTRGEGGQNEVGPELFDALGVLRTEELLAVHRHDGVEQLFGNAYEFGYSYSVEESFARWGKEETLGDVVGAVRAFRPDVILTLGLDAQAGGLHHQAAARLAVLAFRAAADPARFPEQIRDGLRPWQARKVYQGGVGGSSFTGAGAAVAEPTGDYDPLLGMSPQELGSRARTAHRSQRVRHLFVRPGPASGTYSLVDSEPVVRWPEADILQGIDASLAGLARFAGAEAPSSVELGEPLRGLQGEADAARASFDAQAPGKSAGPVAAYLARVRQARADLRARGAPADILERLDDEEGDAMAALALAHGFDGEAVTEDPLVVPGQRVVVGTRLWNQGTAPLAVEEWRLEAASGWAVERLEGAEAPLAPGQTASARFALTVAPQARPTQPYWHKDPARDRNVLDVPACRSLPFCPPVARMVVSFRSGETSALLSRPVLWRGQGAAGGEAQAELNVVPALDVRMTPAVLVAAGRAPLTLTVTVVNNRPGPAAARVRVVPPAGWRAEPPDAPLSFRREGETLATRFSLRGPARPPPGALAVGALAELEGRSHGEGAQVVAYPHVQERRLYRPASARLLVLPVAVRPRVSAGYVMGTGDDVPAALAQLGVPVTLLDADALAFGDLRRFTTIVLGVRAYERADVRANQGRLMAYVERGGNLVVQYNRVDFNFAGPPPLRLPDPLPDSPFAPYPAAVSGRRVTDETAPVKSLLPAHPLLTTPNVLDGADWQGWVQERGLQFLDARDARYRNLLSMRDPFPLNADEHEGALVEATVGRGTWTYVGFGLFRQLPAGVPGAYRLLANLVR